MSFFDEVFGGGRGAGFSDLEDQLRQGQGAIRQGTERGLGFLQPFQQGGVDALGQLQGMLGTTGLQNINQILGQYKESPAFGFQKQQAQEGLQNQLQAAGLSGSGLAEQRAGELSSNIAGQGQQQFLQNVLGAQQQRRGGLEDLFSGGLGAAGQQAQLSGQEGQQLANLFGQIGQSQFGGDVAQSQGLTGLFSSLGQLGGLAGGMGGLSGLFGSGGSFAPGTILPRAQGDPTNWINPG